jgi:hypothetical protein
MSTSLFRTAAVVLIEQSQSLAFAFQLVQSDLKPYQRGQGYGEPQPCTDV